MGKREKQTESCEVIEADLVSRTILKCEVGEWDNVQEHFLS